MEQFLSTCYFEEAYKRLFCTIATTGKHHSRVSITFLIFSVNVPLYFSESNICSIKLKSLKLEKLTQVNSMQSTYQKRHKSVLALFQKEGEKEEEVKLHHHRLGNRMRELSVFTSPFVSFFRQSKRTHPQSRKQIEMVRKKQHFQF